MKKSLVTAALAGGLLLASAVPASAAPADHCPHGLTPQEVVSCACEITVTILRDVTGDPWTCAY
jgi:hypothetical protein